MLRRADEVVNVDVSVDTLRTRLRQGKIYGVEKIEQSLNNFFRKGNLSALRELSLRQVAQDQASKSQDYREREGLEQAVIPEKVMVGWPLAEARKNFCASVRGLPDDLRVTGMRFMSRRQTKNRAASSLRITLLSRKTSASRKNWGQKWSNSVGAAWRMSLSNSPGAKASPT